MKKTYILLILFFISCQPKEDMNILEKIISENKEQLGAPAEDPEKFELQIIYTQIDRDANNVPTFTSHKFNVDKNQYFYPASTVKMPTAILTLEKLKQIDISRTHPFQIDSIRPPQRPLDADSTAENGLPSMGHFVKKIFIVSDNDAHNRMYEFLGQEYLNETLRKKGFENTKIIHRIGPSGFPFDHEANKYTNPYKLIGEDNEILYEQDELYALYDDYPVVSGTEKGIGYYDSRRDTIINEPFDFSNKNFINLSELESSLRRVIYPKLFKDSEQFKFSSDQRDFLLSTMKKTPDQYEYHRGHEEYYDSYVKFFMFGDSKDSIPNHIEISNKVGWAYGYLTDCAYIRDTENNIDFFLTATIHVNRNSIYNDGIYEYESIGLPFLAELGRLIYRYELSKKDNS